MASSNMNTAIMATTITAQETTCKSRASDRLLDMSRENSPLFTKRDYLYPGRGNTEPLSPISSNGCVKLCVSGRVFELTLEQVRRYPESLLANPDEMADYFQPAIGMFFFDRNRQVFEYIMQYYQGDGYMEFPDEVPAQLLELELTFYRIGYRIKAKGDVEVEPPMETVWDKGRIFFNDPGSSIPAKIWMCMDIFFILISIIIFVIRTEGVIIELEREYFGVKLSFWVATIFCAAFFTIDLGGRFLFSGNRFKFFFHLMPWLDVVAIIPLYTEIFEDYITVEGDMLNILKLCRMARVARCLKLIRRSKRLILIFSILLECKEELSILLLVWVTGTTISGSIMYYVEEGDNHAKFYSIMESCWWAITTIGTIGYGNIQPISPLGQILTTVIIFCSMIFMTVPMTIIIRRFSDSYEKVERKKVDVKLIGKHPPPHMNHNAGSENNQKSNNGIGKCGVWPCVRRGSTRSNKSKSPTF